MNYKENVTKNIMFNILENLKSSSSYIDSVYVYFPNEKDYFFQTGEKLTSIQDSADQQWLRDFKEHALDEDKWIVPRAFQSYHLQKDPLLRRRACRELRSVGFIRASVLPGKLSQ